MSPLLTVVVLTRGFAPAVAARAQALARQLRDLPGEVLVVSEAPWSEAPVGVACIAAGPGSRGDLLDAGAAAAHGELVAFVDGGTVLSEGWVDAAMELLADPTVGAAGGPHLGSDDAVLATRAAALLLGSKAGSGPLAYRFRACAARDVTELPTSNLVLRRDTLTAVGGFQSPTPMGEDARLAHKLRAILGLRVRYDPRLAVHRDPPALLAPLLKEVGLWGRHRGDLARRMADTSRPFPYLLPPAGLAALVLLLVAAAVSGAGRLVLGIAVGAYLVAAVAALWRRRDAGAILAAVAALPLVHATYAAGFWRGYLGRSLGERRPARQRPRPLRILVFNWRDVAHPWTGGAETYMHELARRWARAGLEVGWISSRYGGTARVEVIDGIRFHRVGGHVLVYPLAALIYLLRLRRRYDVVVDCENGIPFFSPLFSRKAAVLVVFHVHAEVFRSELSPRLRWLALWLEGWLMPRVYRRRTVVTISPSTLDDLVRGGWDRDRIHVVAAGVDLGPEPGAVPADAEPRLVCVGRLKRYKSVDVLLRAMPGILARYPGATLAVVGQGPDRARLERLAWELGLARSVRFHGYVDSRRRDELYAQASVAVCPSAFEGYGVTCLEAGAHGIPVVASDVAGLRDAVRDGETGVLVPYGEPAAMAAAVLSILGDQTVRERMGDAGRTWAAGHSWDRAAREFLEVLDQPQARPAPSRRSSAT